MKLATVSRGGLSRTFCLPSPSRTRASRGAGLPEALTRTPANTTDELVAELRKSLSEQQLVELTAMIAWENFRARFKRGFDVAVQGFSEGASCPLPQRPDPAV